MTNRSGRYIVTAKNNSEVKQNKEETELECNIQMLVLKLRDFDTVPVLANLCDMSDCEIRQNKEGAGRDCNVELLDHELRSCDPVPDLKKFCDVYKYVLSAERDELSLQLVDKDCEIVMGKDDEFVQIKDFYEKLEDTNEIFELKGNRVRCRGYEFCFSKYIDVAEFFGKIVNKRTAPGFPYERSERQFSCLCFVEERKHFSWNEIGFCKLILVKDKLSGIVRVLLMKNYSAIDVELVIRSAHDFMVDERSRYIVFSSGSTQTKLVFDREERLAFLRSLNKHSLFTKVDTLKRESEKTSPKLKKKASFPDDIDVLERKYNYTLNEDDDESDEEDEENNDDDGEQTSLQQLALKPARTLASIKKVTEATKRWEENLSADLASVKKLARVQLSKTELPPSSALVSYFSEICKIYTLHGDKKLSRDKDYNIDFQYAFIEEDFFRVYQVEDSLWFQTAKNFVRPTRYYPTDFISYFFGFEDNQKTPYLVWKTLKFEFKKASTVSSILNLLKQFGRLENIHEPDLLINNRICVVSELDTGRWLFKFFGLISLIKTYDDEYIVKLTDLEEGTEFVRVYLVDLLQFRFHTSDGRIEKNKLRIKWKKCDYVAQDFFDFIVQFENEAEGKQFYDNGQDAKLNYENRREEEEAKRVAEAAAAAAIEEAETAGMQVTTEEQKNKKPKTRSTSMFFPQTTSVEELKMRKSASSSEIFYEVSCNFYELRQEESTQNLYWWVIAKNSKIEFIECAGKFFISVVGKTSFQEEIKLETDVQFLDKRLLYWKHYLIEFETYFVALKFYSKLRRRGMSILPKDLKQYTILHSFMGKFVSRGGFSYSTNDFVRVDLTKNSAGVHWLLIMKTNEELLLKISITSSTNFNKAQQCCLRIFHEQVFFDLLLVAEERNLLFKKLTKCKPIARNSDDEEDDDEDEA